MTGGPPTTAEAVLTFLDIVGRPSEAKLYLDLFRKLPKESFAIVAAEAPIVRSGLAVLVEQLRFLGEVGLFAPVAVGLFDPTVAEAGSRELATRLGGTASIHDAASPDLAEALRAELRAERTPILSFARCHDDGISGRFERLASAARALASRKVVVLSRRGALGPTGRKSVELAPTHTLPCHDGGISVVNLRADFDLLMRSELLDDRERVLMEQVRSMLLHPQAGALLVSVASPRTMLKELFTVKGAGTLIKRGTAVECHAAYDSVNLGPLRELLETSFGRRLRAEFFERPLVALYLEESYRGAAILAHAPIAPFLTKFAVGPVAQGEGIARDLWQAVVRDHPAVFWRARSDNPIAGWYTSLCDGMVRTPMWTVFWRGVVTEDVAEIVEWATAQPADFS